MKCEELSHLAARVYDAFLKGRLTLALAESCTGGLAGAAVTSVPGSSDIFYGSAVTYSNGAKERILGVSSETLKTQGAVSAECAVQMAAGARKIYSSDVAVSITGIAGPDGGTPGKPVGTVWFGVSSADGTCSFVRRFDGTRDEVRESAAIEALLAALECAEEDGSN